jgi:hypothetical protein
MRPDLALTAEEIAIWCDRHKDQDAAAWRTIAALLRDGGTETDMQWPDLVATADRAMDRRRATALREPDGTPKRARLEQRFADAWAIRRALEHGAWKAGHFKPIAA